MAISPAGYPAAALAMVGPVLVFAAVAWADFGSGVVLAIAGVLYPVAMALTGIGAAQASRRQFEALGRLSGRFLDRMRGLPTLVLFNRQEAEAAALGEAAGELRRHTMKVLRVAFLSGTALELLSAGVLACLVWRHRALLGGGADPTAALFSLLLVPAFFAPLRGFAAAYQDRLAAAGAAAALAPLLAEGAPPGLLLEEMPPRVVVTFTDVRLSYDPARPAALDGLSFRANAGETLVLAGPSGAGKSSVLRILMGFTRPEGGRVAINGQDAMALRPAELRRLSGLCRAAAASVPRHAARQHPLRPARRRRPRRSRPRPAPRMCSTSPRPAAGAGYAGGRGGLGPLRRPGAAGGTGAGLPARRAAGAAGRADRASRPRHGSLGDREPAAALHRPHRHHRQP